VRALALAALLLLAAAGCTGKQGASAGSATGHPTTGPTAAASLQGPRIGLEGCTNFGGVFPVPTNAAQALMPAGFSPVPVAGDPAGGVTLYVLALKCDAGTVNGTGVGPALLAYAELAVVPDAPHALKGITDYTMPVLFSATPAPLAQAFAQLHLGRAGDGNVSWTTAAATGTVLAQVLSGGDGFTLAGQSAPTPPAAIASGAFAVFAVQDRQVLGVANCTSTGGQFVAVAVALQAQGNPPLIAQARPATQGFSVSGFSLGYAPAR
jgi:hypothetical protein